MARTSFVLRMAVAALTATAGALAVPVLSSPASAAVSGLTSTYNYTPYDSNNKGLRVDCPSGKKLIGVSESIAGGEGQVRWDQVIPYSDHVYVHAVEDEDGSPWTWSVGATVICSDPLPGLEIVPQTSTTTSNDYNSVAADCTGDNQLLGLGFSINGGSGQVGIDDNKATSSSRATGWAYEDRTGFSGQWSLTEYAICADPLPGYEINQVTGADQSSTSTTVTAKCTGTKRIVGGGGQADGGQGLVILEDFAGSFTSFEVKAYEDQTGTSNLWHLHAYAICATP